jgi:transcriptional regulator with XRE-family HTH domain
LKTGDRIKELRRMNKLTQVELANKLNITDKAVSKWENNLGEPSIDMLLGLSKVFDVSIDYILTGIDREKIIAMSEFEKIAYEDDPEQIKNLKCSLGSSDNKGFTLPDYIYQYEANKTFIYMAKSQYSKYLVTNHHKQDYLTHFLKMSLISNYYDLLTPEVKLPFVPIYQIKVVSGFEKVKKSTNPEVHEDIIDFILHSKKMNDNAWEYLLNTNTLFWGKGLTKILEKSIKDNHPLMGKILDVIESNNKHINERIENSFDSHLKLHTYYLSDNLLVRRHHSQYEVGQTAIMVNVEISRESVLNALENNDYKLADRLNKMSGYKVSDYEIKMDKVNKDKTIAKKDKLRQSVVHDGLVHIEELIKLDDYDLYLELIEYPASELERLQQMIDERKYKLLFDYAQKMKLSYTIQALRKDNIEKLKDELKRDFSGKRYEPNAKYLYPKKSYLSSGIELERFKENNINGKKTILFKDIINYMDYRFFSHAAKFDPTNLDWALEKVVIDRPEEYILQKILLDLGAKLHKRWSEDDGWGYDGIVDQVDDVGTEILKNQIKILMKEGKENE